MSVGGNIYYDLVIHEKKTLRDAIDSQKSEILGPNEHTNPVVVSKC